MIKAAIFIVCAALAAFSYALINNRVSYRVDGVLNDSNSVVVNVYFGNSELDPELGCTSVFPVVRRVPKAVLVEEGALAALFKGPTKAEAARGYFMSNNRGAEIEDFDIRGKTAYVDFSENFNAGVAGSCRVLAIRAEIEATLKQFDSVGDVAISVNGKTEGILEP